MPPAFLVVRPPAYIFYLFIFPPYLQNMNFRLGGWYHSKNSQEKTRRLLLGGGGSYRFRYLDTFVELACSLRGRRVPRDGGSSLRGKPQTGDDRVMASQGATEAGGIEDVGLAVGALSQ